MNIKIKLIVATLSIGLFVVSCKKKDKVTCDGSNPKYNTEIKSIINNNCMPCHGPGGSDNNYSTYQTLLPTLNNGRFEKEVLTKKSMPQNKTMSNADLSKVRCWLDNGHLEN